MPVVLSRLCILFINYISRDLDNTKTLFIETFCSIPGYHTYCVNAALDSRRNYMPPSSDKCIMKKFSLVIVIININSIIFIITIFSDQAL